MAFLIFSKNGPEDAFLLGDNQVIIGRAPDCGLTIESNKLSRKHCKIYPGKNVYIIEDLGSANGTLVNGKKISDPVNLNQGDIIRIGDTVAHFSWHPNLEIKKETQSVKKDADANVKYPKLKLIEAPDNSNLPKEFTLKPSTYIVGRKPGVDILINFKSVSGKHCKIEVLADAIYIEDLGSTNGTRINNIKITEKKQITDGDIVQFEKLKYKLDWEAKRVEKQDASKDDLLFVEDEKKKAPDKNKTELIKEEQKIGFIDDDDDDEIKLEDPDDISFEITFDDEPAPEEKRKEAVKMFEEIGHSDSMDIAQSSTLEEELKKEVQEFLEEGGKKKRSMKSYALLFLEIAFVVAALAVTLFLVLRDKKQDPDNIEVKPVNPPADSLITENWSFEVGIDNADQELKNWVPNIADSDYVYPEIADTVKSGRACLRIDRNDQTMRQSEVYYAQPIQVTGGSAYSLSYAVKNSGKPGAAISKIYYFTDEKGLNENYLKSEFVGECVRNTGDKWIDVSGTTIAPEKAKSARIALTVFGGECVYHFDDVVMRPTTVQNKKEPEFVETTFGLYTLKINSMGMFSIVKKAGDEPEFIIRDSYWVLHHQKNENPVSLSYFTKNLKIIKIAGSENELHCEGVLLDPLGSAVGTDIPYLIKFKIHDNESLNIDIKFAKDMNYTYGLTAYIDEINGELYNSVYNTLKNKTMINYYNLPIRDVYNQPIAFKRIVLPLPMSFLSIDSLHSSNVKADYNESKIRVTTSQKGNDSSLLFELAVNRDAISQLSTEIDSAVISKQTTLAIAYLYELLNFSTHNPLEFKVIHDRINTLSSELLSKKEEFQGILSNLENNPSALLFSHAQNLGNELGQALENDKFASLKLDFNDKFDVITEYRYYIDEVINKIEKLREITKLIADFEEKYRGKIDYAYMLRSENKAKKLLARAYDYFDEDTDNVDDYSMAISIYEQIIHLYPFTRPATVARNQLVGIAFLLNQKADEVSNDKKELANQYRALAKGLCEKVLDTKFTTAGGDIRDYWDTVKKSWTKIADDIITSFYQIAQSEKISGESEDDDDYEMKEDFESWTKDTWMQKEATARETLDTFIKQIASTINPLPEPTEIPDPDTFDGSDYDDDDDDTPLSGDDDDDDEEDE